MGFILFGGLAYLFLISANKDYRCEKEGDQFMYPAWTGYMAFVISLVFCLLFLIYALGLWDAFIEWGHSLKGDKLFIGKPY